MEDKQAKEIFNMIAVAYPSFLKVEGKPYSLSDKVSLWKDQLLQMEYKGTYNRLQEYMQTSPYEPKISDIASFKPAGLNQDWKKSFEDGGVM